MFLIYHQVLLPREEYFPCVFFLHLPFFVLGAVLDDSLNMRLVVHVLHQFVTGSVSHLISSVLISCLAPVEILLIDPILAVIIPGISNECDVLTHAVRG